MLSEKKLETLTALENLKRQYTYLHSDLVLNLISEKQYQEAKQRIIAQTDKIIHEWGFTPEQLGEEAKPTLNDLFSESLDRLNDMCTMLDSNFNEQVHQAIEKIF